jgi:hypothetical protein
VIDGAPGGFMRSPRRVYGEKVGGVQPGVVVVQGSSGGCQGGAVGVEVAVGREEKKVVNLEKFGEYLDQWWNTEDTIRILDLLPVPVLWIRIGFNADPAPAF